jgi:fumarate reductase subunit C
MSARRPYKRPMDGWWRRNPFFVEYMVHEGTAFFVAAYAFILLVGVMKLAEGQAAWDGWVQWLTSPFAIMLHVILLVGFLYHTWTWFNIMPRTLPPIMIGGKRVGPAAITRTGLAAAAGASLLLLIVCWSLAR